MSAPHEITLIGIVTANAWDGDNEITGVAIAVDGEREYVIEKNEYHDDLIRLVRQEVELTGKVKKSDKGKLKVSVTSFRVLSPE